MRKIITSFLFLTLMAVSAFAQEVRVYNGTLKASVVKPALAKAALGTATREDTKLYVTHEADGSYTLKNYNLDVVFKGVKLNLGNVFIYRFRPNGSKMTTKAEPGNPNVILTPGDDPEIDWIVKKEAGLEVDADAIITDDVLEFDVPIVQDFQSFKDVTFELVYSGKCIDTGISDVDLTVPADAPAYNVAGQRVTTTNGIIIKNGKKYLPKR